MSESEAQRTQSLRRDIFYSAPPAPRLAELSSHMEEGPLLETLTRRLAECPADFLAEPRDSSGKGAVYVAAVVYDLIRDLGGAPLTKAATHSV